MQIVRLPPGNISQIMQIKSVALKDLDHRVGMGDLSDVCNGCTDVG